MATPVPAIRTDAYREAKLALLGMQARQQIELTDASMRTVEDALARLDPIREAATALFMANSPRRNRQVVSRS
jgi:hypothetical protein